MKRTFAALLGLGLLASCGHFGVPAPTPVGDSTRALPATISAGQTFSAVIAGEARDFDYYTFDAAAGDRLRIDVKAPSGSTLDPYVRLYAADGWVLLERDDDGEYNPADKSVDAQILFNADKAGRYVVEVSSFKLVNEPQATDDNPKNTYVISLNRR